MFGHFQIAKLFLRWTLTLTLIIPTLGGYPGRGNVKMEEAHASSTLALAPVGEDQPAITAAPTQAALPETGDGPAFVGWDQRGHVAFAPDHLIVRFRPGVKPALDAAGRVHTGQPSLDNRLAAQGVMSVDPLFLTPRSPRPLTKGLSPEEFGLTRIYRLWLRPGTDVQQAAEALAADPNVEWAEPDYIAHAAFIPNDPRYPDQWGLPQIQAPQAWDVTQGSPAVAIAIVDTGIDLNHPDLAGKLWVNPGEIPGNGIDDDGNGKVDDVNGWDWVNNDNVPQDDIGHGTHVAGIAAAATNNGTGVAGVCPNCRVMALKVLDAGGSGTYSNIAAGIIYAADKGAKVINLSLGGYADSQLLRDAVAYASQYAVVVAAAGNDNKQDRFYPAAYDDYVVAVAATDNNDQKAAFSNYGDWVDIAAPGVSVWSTLYDDTYAAWSGSSMAAPFVSGVAGLVRSKNPSWSAGAARGQLLHTADGIDSLNPGYEGKLGAGRVNAYRAVTVAALPEITIAGYSINGVPNGNPEPGSTVTMTVSLRNTWGDATNVTGTLTTTDPHVTVSTDTASWGAVAGYTTATNAVPFILTISSTAPYNHPIALTLTVGAGGITAALPITAVTQSGIQYVGGIISDNTVWTSDKTYVVISNILVNKGVTLTIQPGTVIAYAGAYYIQIDGTLSAAGTRENPIVFKAGGNGILFGDSSTDYDPVTGSGSILAYARFEGISGYDGTAVRISNASPLITHNWIFPNGNNGISAWGTNSEISFNEISGTGYIALSASGNPLVKNNYIHQGLSTL
jgi:thermitase